MIRGMVRRACTSFTNTSELIGLCATDLGSGSVLNEQSSCAAAMENDGELFICPTRSTENHNGIQMEAGVEEYLQNPKAK